jgi:hypothetical protein
LTQSAPEFQDVHASETRKTRLENRLLNDFVRAERIRAHLAVALEELLVIVFVNSHYLVPFLNHVQKGLPFSFADVLGER